MCAAVSTTVDLLPTAIASAHHGNDKLTVSSCDEGSRTSIIGADVQSDLTRICSHNVRRRPS